MSPQRGDLVPAEPPPLECVERVHSEVTWCPLSPPPLECVERVHSEVTWCLVSPPPLEYMV